MKLNKVMLALMAAGFAGGMLTSPSALAVNCKLAGNADHPLCIKKKDGNPNGKISTTCDGAPASDPDSPIPSLANGCYIDGVGPLPCVGTNLSEVIIPYENNTDDVINANGGDDVVYVAGFAGGAGNPVGDLVCLGSGDDLLLSLSNAGKPKGFGPVRYPPVTAFGEDGDDVMLAFPLPDVANPGATYSNYLEGGKGNDTLFSGFGDDESDGDVGHDSLVDSGNTGNSDIMTGGPGNDFILGDVMDAYGLGGKDVEIALGVFSPFGVSQLFGMGGTDLLVGLFGLADITAGGGNDVLIGNGNLNGGGGANDVCINTGPVAINTGCERDRKSVV